MTPPFLDTNVFAHVLTKTPSDFAIRCRHLLNALTSGEQEATCSISVLTELAWLLEKVALMPRGDIIHALKSIAETTSIELDHRDAILDALEFWKDNGPLSFPDCYHLALAKRLGCKQIYTFDKQMGRYPGIDRIEP